MISSQLQTIYYHIFKFEKHVSRKHQVPSRIWIVYGIIFYIENNITYVLWNAYLNLNREKVICKFIREAKSLEFDANLVK